MYKLSENPPTRSEAYKALEDVVAKGNFGKADAVDILQQVLDLDGEEAGQQFDALLSQGYIEEA